MKSEWVCFECEDQPCIVGYNGPYMGQPPFRCPFDEELEPVWEKQEEARP